MTSPVIVIGAGRSGTNMLRDVLCAFDHFHTWPCDEINYIWRHGNRDHPTDELTADLATTTVSRDIHRAFEKRAALQPSARVVEKTCANSLRVPFVHRVFPDAQFVHLVRDGRAVAASAMKRWTAPLDLPYLARKARYVPPTDLPHYAYRYLSTRIGRLRSSEERLSWWGPRFEGMQDLSPTDPLEVVAATQWRACVEKSAADLAAIPASQVHTCRYEDLTENPTATLSAVLEFLGTPASEEDVQAASTSIRSGDNDSWRLGLSDEQQRNIEAIVGPVTQQLGYRE